MNGEIFGRICPGGLVGVVVVLLVAPAAGEELCNRVQNEIKRVRGEVTRASQTHRDERNSS